MDVFQIFLYSSILTKCSDQTILLIFYHENKSQSNIALFLMITILFVIIIYSCDVVTISYLNYLEV